MKPHPTSAFTTLTRSPGNLDTTAQRLAHPAVVGDRSRAAQAVRERPPLTLAGAPVWKHKLILTGKLDDRTVVELEDELECLREEGVRILTLDLRQLDAIDPVAARAIARGGAACKQQGREFAVVPGSPVIHRALVEAGAEGLLADTAREAGVLAAAAGASNGSPRNTSTVMVKNL